MYPSNSNSNHNPTSVAGQVIQHRHLFNNDINPNSKFSDPSSASLFHFPSSYMLYEDVVSELTWQQLPDIFLQQQSLTTAETISSMVDLKTDAVNEGITEKITRKRSSKKDRHSKINTAHGPRDRRMRLSLEVARKFFDLQDMLGFDKASKTVEWLLTQSSSAIKEIMGTMPRIRHSCSVGANSVSSTSECEGVSGVDESTTNENQQASISVKLKIKSSSNKEKKAKLACRTALHRIARESRKIARERARKRTVEKKRLGESKSCIEEMDNYLNRLGSWNHFETGEESGIRGTKINHSSYEGLKQVEELNSRDQQLLGTIEYAAGDSLVITGNWNTSTICNFQQNAEISHEHHFADFDQYCGKPWEACNNL